MRPQSHRRRFVNKILTLFKKTHSSENAQYPSELLAKYKISDKTLGVGSFAVVKQCTKVNSKEECAVKIILKKVIAGKYGYDINLRIPICIHQCPCCLCYI
jgi:calcium/calmodulin-dependent protein kinase I